MVAISCVVDANSYIMGFELDHDSQLPNDSLAISKFSYVQAKNYSVIVFQM